jgi:hypothetical protein
LWSRLAGFDPHGLGALMEARRVVRIVAIRVTIHLVTAEDALLLRPVAQEGLDRELRAHRDHRPHLAGVDLAPMLAEAGPFLAEPRTGRQLRAFLAERFPDVDAAALAYACRCLLPLVQVPPRGVWGKAAQVTLATVDGWLGRPVEAAPDVDAVVLRYLAAYGPATAADVATWSSLTGVREVLDRLAPRLRAFTDERGRALVDLPDAPRPAPDTPAPPRFLPEFDNALLSHADRRRFVSDERRVQLGPPPRAAGTVLVDGGVGGTWWLERDAAAGTTALVVRHLGPLDAVTAEAVDAEGRRLLAFLATGGSVAPSGHDVRLVPAEC